MFLRSSLSIHMVRDTHSRLSSRLNLCMANSGRLRLLPNPITRGRLQLIRDRRLCIRARRLSISSLRHINRPRRLDISLHLRPDISRLPAAMPGDVAGPDPIGKALFLGKGFQLGLSYPGLSGVRIIFYQFFENDLG